MDRPRLNAQPWLHRTLLGGAGMVTGAIAYHLSLATLPASGGPEIPVRELVALATSIVLVTVAAPGLRQAVERFSAPSARKGGS